nr:HAD family acid phosphatase [Granulicella tundricola]
MRRSLSFAAVVLVFVGGMWGQESAGPPACPVAKKLPVPLAPGQTFHPVEVARPSVEAARKTAEGGAVDPSVLVAAEPLENFGVARYRLKDYGDCVGNGGCYWSDVQAQAMRAKGALDMAVQGHKAGEKLALVLDIDETTLSSYCEMKREDFGYIPEMFNGWVVTPEAAVAVPGMMQVFEEARAKGVAVFFLTGRPEEQRAATERNLKAVGYSGWAGLVLRNAEEKGMPTVAYKAAERGKIVAAGYRIVMSVGDQWSDLNGEPRAEISVKLPNPFYYLP